MQKPLALIRPAYSVPRPLAFALGRDVPAPNPYPPLVAGSIGVSYEPAVAVHACLDGTAYGQDVGACLDSQSLAPTLIKACRYPYITPFVVRTACLDSQVHAPIATHACVQVSSVGFLLLDNALPLEVATTSPRHACVSSQSMAAVQTKHCQTSFLTPIAMLEVSMDALADGSVSRHLCHPIAIAPTIAVPCRYYYPLPQAPAFACPAPPPSDRLPLPLMVKQPTTAYALPMAFACKGSLPTPPADPVVPIPSTPVIAPSQRGYIMHHTILAFIQGKAVNPIAFDLQTDMASFCFSGQIELSWEDYHVIKDFERPLIKVVISGISFVLVGEDTTIHQSFGRQTISLSGRSISAALASEYATSRPIDDTELYASQIVAAQLAHAPVQANFAITDYRIPKGAYTSTGKSPIAVLEDIAAACGGFLYSDPALPILHLLPRYKHPAWQISTAAADVVISLDAIKTLSTTHQNRPLYNTITLVGQTQGGIVYRLDMGQDKEASVSSHPLYTEQACIVQAGTALLSDSGDKSKISLTTLLSDSIPLAKLGDIWQIGANGIKAVVVSVALSAATSDGVVSVWQTVGLIGHGK